MSDDHEKENRLNELKQLVRKLKNLHSKLIDHYLSALDEENLKGSTLAEINAFLRDNRISLSTMIDLNAIGSLRYLDGVQGQLESGMSGEVEYEDLKDLPEFPEDMDRPLN